MKKQIKAFIIYGFYGTGKTTFCTRHPLKAKDYDGQYMQYDPEMRQQFQTDIKTEKILFINDFKETPIESVSLIFVPKTGKILQKRLKMQKRKPEFIKETIQNFDLIKKDILQAASRHNIPVIELDENSYISNHGTTIINLLKERKNHYAQ